ncbi:hypothetical protein J3R30DRAFT_3300017 [Lentinula aciculospora]|uniref:AB hydrolase-1 domain-containing protein n=1 Tax=Lentinula aciculospora TaxID=153920 RepID=A0A9W9DIM3_9AGAR|nr:hypothetical protein J3R30DRAFT_3300017 [Lentinula aciculospora]
MPTFYSTNETQCYYDDSGVPDTPDYTTYFVVHGHSYHGGVFKRLLPVAHQHSHRMLAINRREYPNSTPYTDAEICILARGSDEERSRLLLNEGTILALLLDGLIQLLALPPNIVIVGWSLGNTFALSMLASITSLTPSVRNRLGGSVKKTIMWEPPAHGLGMKLPPLYIPLLDDTISPDERPLVFMKWVALHFQHGDLSLRHDLTQVDQGNDNRERTSSFDATPPEELTQITDLRPGARCDNHLIGPGFTDLIRSIANKALFDPTIRLSWTGMDIWHLVGDRGPHTVHIATWYLEDQMKLAGTSHPAIQFAVNPGAGHFYMWENPEGAMKELELITRSV